MIEAPEALHLSQQLNDVIRGKVITDVIIGFTPHKFMFCTGDPEEYISLLMGQTIHKVDAKGGMIEISLGDRYIVFTDGMNIHYCEPGGKLPLKHQVLIGFEDQSYIIGTIRMYGGVLCFKENDFSYSISPYYVTACEKPQVMSEEFTKEYFLSLINADEMKKKSTKAFLATGQTIPGLGNGVLQDILYKAKIHPKTKIQSLTDTQKEFLYDTIKNTLWEMYEKKGRNSETDIYGVSGLYIPYLSKDTAGKECPHCDSIIRKESYLGGSIYYCDGCQK